MLDDETKMLAHHARKIGNNALLIFQPAVNEDPGLFIEAQAQIAVAVYTICEAMVRLNIRLGNISYFATDKGKRKADMEGGRRKWMHQE